MATKNINSEDYKELKQRQTDEQDKREEARLVFGPKPKIIRSPINSRLIDPETIQTPKPHVYHRERASSMSDVSQHTPETISVNKRKRIDTPDKEPNLPNSELNNLVSNLRHIFNEVSNLEDILRTMYKPKTEIVELAGRMRMYLNYLDPGTIEKCLEGVRNDPHPVEVNTVMESTHNNPDIRCAECRKEQARYERRWALKEDESFENFRKTTEDDWITEVFPRAIEQNMPIWEAPLQEGIILPCSMNFESNNKMISAAINKFGGRVGLAHQKKEKGDVAYMTYTLGFPDNKGNMFHATRNIYYPIIEDGVAWEKVDDKVLFQSIQKLKKDVLRDEISSIAIPEISNVNGLIFKRIVEYLFADSGVEISMYRLTNEATRQKSNQTQKDPTASTSGTKPNKNTSKPTKKNRNEAVLVQMEGKNYSDMLKLVKQTVDPSQVGVDVHGVSETKSGKLLLTIKNGMGKAEALRDELKRKIPEATSVLLTNNKIIHIKGMDGVIEENEIRDSICNTISIKAEEIKLSALRPAFGNKRNITVTTSEANAQKLINLGNIRIGWAYCKIQERKKEPRCFRCWRQGHPRAQCKGPNRENLCMKCGEEGHMAKNCTNEAHCLDCNKHGHQTGSRNCHHQ